MKSKETISPKFKELLENTFKAGEQYVVGSNILFKKVYPNKKEYITDVIKEWNLYIDSLIEEENETYNNTHSSYFDGRIDMLHNLKIDNNIKL